MARSRRRAQFDHNCAVYSLAIFDWVVMKDYGKVAYHFYGKYVLSHQLMLKKMRAGLANLNHCAVPFLSCPAVNLSWYDSIKYLIYKVYVIVAWHLCEY